MPGPTARPVQKYRVMIRGENLLTEVGGVRQWLGFYTHVFVEVFTPADAESRAIELLRDDEGLRGIQLNPEDDPPSLSVEESDELESFDGYDAPRSAFILYPLAKRT